MGYNHPALAQGRIIAIDRTKLYTAFQGLRQITLYPISWPFNKDVLLPDSLVVYLEDHGISRLSSW